MIRSNSNGSESRVGLILAQGVVNDLNSPGLSYLGIVAVIKLQTRCQHIASEGAWISQNPLSNGIPAGAGTVFNSVLVCSGEAMAVSDQCRGSLLKRSNFFLTQEDSGVLRQLFMWDDVSNKCYRTSCYYGKINYIKKDVARFEL